MTKSAGNGKSGGAQEFVLMDGIEYRSYERRMLLEGHLPGRLCGRDLTPSERRFADVFSRTRHWLVELVAVLYDVQVVFLAYPDGRNERLWFTRRAAPVRFVTLDDYAARAGIDLSEMPYRALQNRLKAALAILKARLKEVRNVAMRASGNNDFAEAFLVDAMRCMPFEASYEEVSFLYEDVELTSHDILAMKAAFEPAMVAAADYNDARRALFNNVKNAGKAA